MFSSHRMSKVLATGAVVAAVACSSAFAASNVKATADVNVRSQPSTSSSVKCVLPEGKVAAKLGTSGNWVKVKYKDVTGYVYKSYVKDVNSSSSSSSASSQSSKTVFITASSLNVRSGPSTSYDSIGSLSKGASVKTYGSTNGWYKIKYNGRTAYISAKYTSSKAPSGSSSSNSSSGNSAPSNSSSSKKVYVTASSLNVRSGPSTNYNVVGSLKEGAAVTTYGSTDGWYKIKYNGKTAYISAKYTSSKASSGSSNSSSNSSSSSSNKVNYNVKITASALNVRSGPSTDYGVKGTLHEGDVVKASALKDGWYKISFSGETGYISSKYAVKTSASASTGSGSSSSGSSGSSDTSSSAGSSLSSSERSKIVSMAKNKLGCSYVYGAEGPNSFDCSGFTQWLYKQLGVSIPRSSSSQWGGCNKINKSSLKPGDLVFFSNSSSGGSVGHVAMYIGNDTIIHAANSDSGVITSSLSSNYYSSHYVGSGRY